MTNFLTEEEVREFTRSELQRLREAEQARCRHARSATLTDGIPVCDQCGALITPDSEGTFNLGDKPLSPLEQKHISYGKEKN